MARNKKAPGKGKRQKRNQADIPADHDWRTTDAQEIERRRQRAREEKMGIKNLNPTEGVFSNFRVHSASGRDYQVEIRGLDPLESSCECVDFLSNGLGTCKHVEAVLLKIRPRVGKQTPHVSLTQSPRIDVVVDRQVGTLRLRAAAGTRIPKAIRLSFGDNTLLLPNADPAATVARLQELTGSQPKLRVSMEVEAWLELERRRRESSEARHEYETRVQSGEWPPHETLVPLLPYQREGMLHLAFKERALLADEMGLGKTIQAIAACALLHRLGRVRRVLVVAPASLKAEWEEQIKRFTPLPSLLVYGHHLARKQVYQKCTNGPDQPFFILTNYEQVIPDLQTINDVLKPDVVILDEAQRIKNWNTKTSRRIKQLRSRFAFVLTGTPIENRIDELRSLVDYLDPAVLGPLFRFNREFHLLDDRGRSIGVQNLDVLHERVKPLLLRRRKTDVADELPARTDQNRFVQLTPGQRIAYSTHEQEVMILAQIAEKRPLSQQQKDKLQRELAMMRMICDTNYILDREDRECPKLAEITRILEDAAAEGSKVILFSEWERMLELVRDHCLDRGIQFAWHTGSVPQQRRRADINRFKQDPDCRVFLTTDAGATGLNLQAASIVVNCDLPWNPARLEQRIARAWRKFQTQAVTVINLISEGTIESRMLETLATKRSIAESVLDRSTDITSIILRKSTKDTAERLRQLTGQSQTPATTDPAQKPAERPRPRDLSQEFASRLHQRLGTQLVACEERTPIGGGPVQILIVSQHLGHARAPWLDALRDEFFPSVEGNPPAHRVEILDHATFDAIERLVKAGVLQRTEASRRDLLDPAAIPSGPPALTAEEEARLREATTHAERSLRRAHVLGSADFPEEALASLRESLLPMATARSIRQRWSVPTCHDELLTDPWPDRWSKALPAVRQLIGSAGKPPADWQPCHATLVAWLG